TSACAAAKPRSTLRPKLPCWPLGAAVNAALLKILPPGNCAPSSSRGTPGFTFGRGESSVPPAIKIGETTSTGGADLAKTKVSSDQPPNTALTICCDPGEGKS